MRWIILLLFLFLSACSTIKPEERFGATCEGNGLEPGSEAYQSCIDDLEQKRLAKQLGTVKGG